MNGRSIEEERGGCGRPARPHLYTEEEYEVVRSTVDRMARGGVTLLGGG
jgi:hypothetical protein